MRSAAHLLVRLLLGAVAWVASCWQLEIAFGNLSSLWNGCFCFPRFYFPLKSCTGFSEPDKGIKNTKEIHNDEVNKNKLKLYIVKKNGKLRCKNKGKLHKILKLRQIWKILAQFALVFVHCCFVSNI